jgi:aminoglycoside 6'-N-acetyltransferase I
MTIRPATRSDAGDWERLRHALWPAEQGAHARNIERYFLGASRDPLACCSRSTTRETPSASSNCRSAYAEGSSTDRVAFVEGWYVDARVRGKGVGAALIRAAEGWARNQGCSELGSDADVNDTASGEAHRAVGFTETAVIRCFLKPVADS